jgi:hypothetical protein
MSIPAVADIVNLGRCRKFCLKFMRSKSRRDAERYYQQHVDPFPSKHPTATWANGRRYGIQWGWPRRQPQRHRCFPDFAGSDIPIKKLIRFSGRRSFIPRIVLWPRIVSISFMLLDLAHFLVLPTQMGHHRR